MASNWTLLPDISESLSAEGGYQVTRHYQGKYSTKDEFLIELFTAGPISLFGYSLAIESVEISSLGVAHFPNDLNFSLYDDVIAYSEISGPTHRASVTYSSATEASEQERRSSGKPAKVKLEDGSVVTYNARAGIELLEINPVQKYWENLSAVYGNKVQKELPQHLRIPTLFVELSWTGADPGTIETLSDLVGKVNKTNFQMPVTDKKYGAERVLFDTFDSTTEIRFKEGELQEVRSYRLNFQVRLLSSDRVFKGTSSDTTGSPKVGKDWVTWNHFYYDRLNIWAKVSNVPVTVTENADLNYTFPLGNFRQLFKV
jgi:hypothetical protein